MSRAGLLLLLGVLLVGAGVFLALPRLESTAPTVTAPKRLVLGREPQTLTVHVDDFESGVRSTEVRLLFPGGSKTLASQTYPGGTLEGGAPGTDRETLEIRLDAEALGVPDGAATLVVDVRDWSWREGGNGNRAEHQIALDVDTQSPTVSVESGLTYIHRGGAAAVVYRVDDDATRDGVQVGDAFYRGHPMESEVRKGRVRRVAIFAIPIDSAVHPPVHVVAVDAAGNEGRARFAVQIRQRKFADTSIALSQRFLDTVVVDLATANDIDFADRDRAFNEINTQLRADNEARIRELIADGASERFFAGRFDQLRNSKVTSRFAEFRTYTSAGERISTARHYGFDLASTAHAPITAANNGVVHYAGDLGIYGNCVLVDHGLGVTTLYGHLSRLDVAAGDAVARGQILGLSGATGFAGGDHLHFAVMVGATYVDPMEWWDPKWVRNHIETRLEP